jgi:hypothetical protein
MVQRFRIGGLSLAQQRGRPGCLPCAPVSIAPVRAGGHQAPSPHQRSSMGPLRQWRARLSEVQGHVVRHHRVAVVTQRVWFRAPHPEPSPFVQALGLGRRRADAEVDP